jgi:hypothetical protein
MTLLAATFLMAATASALGETRPATDAARLAALAHEIRAADYRGARADLLHLADELATVRDPALGGPAAYWRGFALWRRAINGFNETPAPPDLRKDLEAAMASFHAALDRQPEWIEPRIGASGCMMSLLFLAGNDSAWRLELLAQFRPMWQETVSRGGDNPRVLWLLGGSQFGAPPPWGGDAVKAVATLRKGLEAARREALTTARSPGYAPTWGAAESLMSLAYVHAHATGALQNRAVARAYAEGALALAPEWHYVRDILLVQIEAVPSQAGR